MNRHVFMCLTHLLLYYRIVTRVNIIITHCGGGGDLYNIMGSCEVIFGSLKRSFCAREKKKDGSYSII